jgi:alkylhydroperoxidase family enzyme
MPRLPYLDPSDVAAEHHGLFFRNFNLYRGLMHSPQALRAFRTLGRFIRESSTLDGRLREMAILQVGYLARAPYEWAHHVEIGRRFGVSDADIRAISEETAGRATGLDPLAKTVLRAAREMTRELGASDATFAELRQGLSNEHVTDLVIAIAFYNAVVRVLATMQIDLEDEYKKYLDEFPLPAGG